MKPNKIPHHTQAARISVSGSIDYACITMLDIASTCYQQLICFIYLIIRIHVNYDKNNKIQ